MGDGPSTQHYGTTICAGWACLPWAERSTTKKIGELSRDKPHGSSIDNFPWHLTPGT
jgi:hypothetical protein